MHKADRDRIEALEMWIWRRMKKISWMDKVTNEEVLKKVNESKNMLNVTRQRKSKWIDHVLRHDEFLQEIFEGRMKGKPRRGRKRTQLLDDLPFSFALCLHNSKPLPPTMMHAFKPWTRGEAYTHGDCW